jgi:hypothetical protein
VAATVAERDKATESRLAARRRMEGLAQRPDGLNKASIMSYADSLEAAEVGRLYATPDEVAVKLQALRDVGAEYVLLNSTGGVTTLRHLSREVLPAFSGGPEIRAAVYEPVGDTRWVTGPSALTVLERSPQENGTGGSLRSLRP